MNLDGPGRDGRFYHGLFFQEKQRLLLSRSLNPAWILYLKWSAVMIGLIVLVCSVVGQIVHISGIQINPNPNHLTRKMLFTFTASMFLSAAGLLIGYGARACMEVLSASIENGIVISLSLIGYFALENFTASQIIIVYGWMWIISVAIKCYIFDYHYWIRTAVYTVVLTLWNYVYQTVSTSPWTLLKVGLSSISEGIFVVNNF